MSDPQVKQNKQAVIGQQSGGGLNDIRVYMGPSKQIGRGFGNVFKNIGMKIIPVVISTAKKWFTSSSEAFKYGASIGDSFKAAPKPTLRTALKHGGKALGKIIQEQEMPTAAPPVEPPLLHQMSGTSVRKSRRPAAVAIKPRKNASLSDLFTQANDPTSIIIFNLK